MKLKSKWVWIKAILFNRVDLDDVGEAYIRVSAKSETQTKEITALQETLKAVDEQFVSFSARVQRFVADLRDVAKKDPVYHTVPKYVIHELIEDHGFDFRTDLTNLN